MKKLVLLLVAFILVAGFCFAQEEEETAPAKPEKLDLEITIGVPIHWTNSLAPHKFYGTAVDEDKTVTANTAIGIALLFNVNKKLGFTFDFDFFVGADVMGHTDTDSYSNTLFGANALLGPVIYLYNGSFLRIPLAIGLHAYYWSSDHWDGTMAGINTGNVWVKTTDLQLGLGISLGIQFHFNDSLYIFSRTNAAIDVFRLHKVSGNDGTDEIKESHAKMEIGWLVKPTIGVGVKF